MNGLFVGRSTYDLEYLCSVYPPEDSNVYADGFFANAGGPALNAAVTYSALGGKATLLSVVGTGIFSAAVIRELDQYRVNLVDAGAGQVDVLPVTSIVVNSSTGFRTIINRRSPAHVATPAAPSHSLSQAPHIVLSDGHFADLAEPILKWARASGATVVFDGGSWKLGTERLLKHVDIAILAEKFSLPGAHDYASRFAALEEYGIIHVAITRGPEDILWRDKSDFGSLQPPRVNAVDTLGAGDIMHGAFCHAFARSGDFRASIKTAAELASKSCTYWGTREWIAGLSQ